MEEPSSRPSEENIDESSSMSDEPAQVNKVITSGVKNNSGITPEEQAMIDKKMKVFMAQ